ncbi:MAG: 16S rRNA (guanine(527)-N(7))-methyltransferase RsmG [Thermoleophilia bacterium]
MIYHLDEDQIASLARLRELLISQTDRNLTAVSDPDVIIRVHFLDNLWLLGLPEMTTAGEVVDIGSGAGFPGLPLAIARPDLNFSLIESNGKKSAFISRCIDVLGLKNATVLPQRAEEVAGSQLRETFDLALARAVGSLPEILEYALPLLKLGGHALLQRGARESRDLHAAGMAAALLGGEPGRIIEATPYPQAKNLHVWVFNKVAASPPKYPRRPGMARKRPLGS